MPEDFRRALKRGGLWEYFNESAWVHRAAYVSWIVAVRTPARRRAKIEQALLRLAAQRREDEVSAPPRSKHEPRHHHHPDMRLQPVRSH